MDTKQTMPIEVVLKIRPKTWNLSENYFKTNKNNTEVCIYVSNFCSLNLCEKPHGKWSTHSCLPLGGA